MNMKKSVILLTSLLLLASCQEGTKNINKNEIEDNSFSSSYVTGELGDFDLVSPGNLVELDEITTFSWTASSNAETYSLEICASEYFISDIDIIDYYIERNIAATSFAVKASFSTQNTYYYWRVFAYNHDGSKQSTSTYSFYYKAPEVEEVKFDLGDADDWTLHSLGSHADISIDNSNFFENDEESLVISFKGEDMKRGIIESDGWIVVTKTIEKSIYGTDALYFNMYYAGQDASVFIRLVDKDNEYWYCPVQISNNAKQTVFLKFTDFIQRYNDVTVANETFDYERIKYMEVVFEKTFGDGVFLISDVKAIKFDNYRDRFIEKLNYLEYDESLWVNEGYEFEKTVTNDELTLNYYSNTEGKPRIGQSGYGFAKIYVGRYFFGGDSIKVKVRYNGSKGTNVVIRVYEEDTDRWSYRIPFSLLDEGEYKELVIPFAAFMKSDILGDGKRQFYYIINLQFGLEGQYGTGDISFKDFEIVNKSDYAVETSRLVESDGMIEDFDKYQSANELYFIWETTEANKDEQMLISSAAKTGNKNVNCAQFEYKSDMEAATYTLPIETASSFSSISIDLKDNSTKSSDRRLSHVSVYSADAAIYLHLVSGEMYKYSLGNIERVWTRYDLPFSSFTLANEEDISIPSPIVAKNIIKIGISLQFFYYDIYGNPLPMYSISNAVYLDNIKFGQADEYSAQEIERVVRMNGNIALVDDFEGYEDSDDLSSYWLDGRTYEYQKKELSNEVSSEGGNHSAKLQYKSNSESISYYCAPTFDQNVVGRGLRVSIKANGLATIYINLYITIGSNTLQYRYTVANASESWTEYSIGLNNFVAVDTTTYRPDANDIKNISRISFGAVQSGDATASLYDFYIDNLMFDYSLSYTDLSTRTIQ